MSSDLADTREAVSDRPVAEPAAARFRLLERLGGGGAGEVYRAQDRLLGREVALKVLRDGAGAEGDAAREARRLAALSHAAIAGIYELVRLPDGRSALVMERVEGPELAAALASGPLPIEEALDLGIGLARALAYAHGRGVVHGDLKPANVLLPSAGAPKLVDFGFGRLAGDGDGPGEPESGAAGGLGTLGYAAPERLRGGPPDPPGDLFSLGCLLYHAVAGRPPFAGGSAREVVEGTLRLEPLPLGALRPETPFLLDRAIRRLLAKEPAARPGSAGEVAAELEAIRAEGPRPGLAAGEAPAGPAFRGLLAFQEVDAGEFFGREQDLRGLVAMVTSPERRFAVLHGESGCGKTSLIRAGLIPRLRSAGWLALYSRVYQGPVDALVAAAGREAGVAADAGAAEPPHRVLERVAEAVGAPVLVVLDQFEEAFTTLPPEERERLVALVASCQGGEPAGVRFLVSVRSDFLHLVGEAFDRSVREPLAVAGRYRLRSFTREQAEEVLARSAGAGELPADPGLWPVVAADLLDQGRVLPSELQIVGEEIQRRRLLTEGAYRRSGGKEALVEGFLDEVLAGSGDDEAARRLLSALISPEGTRLPS
ncbi:MAG TPA: serine/threonine-protein kinase, partial [Thermoanaerobaculia bacterium]|nr:serine/threonine-protein kinase [Thermoanaerobaculia bacterium]